MRYFIASMPGCLPTWVGHVCDCDHDRRGAGRGS